MYVRLFAHALLYYSELLQAINPHQECEIPHTHMCICIYVHTHVCMYVCAHSTLLQVELVQVINPHQECKMARVHEQMAVEDERDQLQVDIFLLI